ncbi:class I SAM-dependent methyltransferase [Candidatus Parcubacteria bacterium]|nr:MAG: class I SAM-dependent methyltransferase [Candidatus Parcubacteria bacterium]
MKEGGEATKRVIGKIKTDLAKGTITNSFPWEGREAAVYLYQLGIQEEHLEGRRVLDLGAGRDLNFAKNLPEEGIHAEVISLSPAFEYLHTHLAKDPHESTRLAVAGMGEELPFKENSFDTVVMFYVTLHIDTDERMVAILKEIVRVLKPEGVAYIGPLMIIENQTTGIDRSKRWLDQQKVNEALKGTAVATWNIAPNVPAGQKAKTLFITKNKE